jgi:hypothetical protein
VNSIFHISMRISEGLLYSERVQITLLWITAIVAYVKYYSEPVFALFLSR